jgi:hypothetical protein
VIEKECPEKIRLAGEIMKLLIKRQTSLADGLDALTTVMLNALKAKSGGARANEFDLLLSHFSEEVRRFSESMKRDRVSRLHSVSVKRLWHRIGQALARAGTNLRNKLGHGGGLQGTMVDKERPERVRHLAIEISDLLNKRGPSPLRRAVSCCARESTCTSESSSASSGTA